MRRRKDECEANGQEESPSSYRGHKKGGKKSSRTRANRINPHSPDKRREHIRPVPFEDAFSDDYSWPSSHSEDEHMPKPKRRNPAGLAAELAPTPDEKYISPEGQLKA